MPLNRKKQESIGKGKYNRKGKYIIRIESHVNKPVKRLKARKIVKRIATINSKKDKHDDIKQEIKSHKM